MLTLRNRRLAIVFITIVFCFLPAVSAFACDACDGPVHEVVVRSSARPAERPAPPSLDLPAASQSPNVLRPLAVTATPEPLGTSLPLHVPLRA